MEDKHPQTDIVKERLDSEHRNIALQDITWQEKYDRRILLSFFIASFLLVAFFLTVFCFSSGDRENTAHAINKDKKEQFVQIIDIPLQPKKPVDPPLPEAKQEAPPQAKPKMPKVKTVKFVPLEVAKNDHEVTEPVPPGQEALLHATASDKNREGVEDSTGVFKDTDDSEGDATVKVEQPWFGPLTREVSFPGGVPEYINNNISQKLKDFIKDRDIKGKMYVMLIIGQDGKVVNVEIPPGKELSGCSLCSNEIVAILKEMPAWKPAEYNGKTVMRKISLPVVF